MSEIKSEETQLPWLEGQFITEKGEWPNKMRYYVTPDGDLPSSTTVLKVLGLSTEGLIRWSADVERKAALEVCGNLHAEMAAKGERLGPENFVLLADKRMGQGRKHVRELEKAGQIGTEIHRAIEWRVARLLGEDAGEEPGCQEKAMWAVMAWEDWFKNSGLTMLRREQPVWWPGDEHCPGYAGTLDILCEHPERGIGILDTKSSKGIYLDQHLQVWSYVKAARRHVDVQWGQIVRVPKNVDDPEFEVRDLGHHIPWKGEHRMLNEYDLDRAWAGACNAFHVLMGVE